VNFDHDTITGDLSNTSMTVASVQADPLRISGSWRVGSVSQSPPALRTNTAAAVWLRHTLERS
jgi:hypothetical protein